MSIVLFKYFIHFLYIFYMELINNKLELALSRLNIRQEDLGSIMGLSQSSVSLIKNGKRGHTLTINVNGSAPLLRHLQKKTPVIIEIAGVTC